MRYFKVKTGYGKDDFISITEDELPMAVRAQVNGKVGVFENGTVSGNHIMSITPDFNRLMGWNRDYVLGEEDYDDIGQKRVNEHRDLLQSVKNSVMGIAEPAKSGELREGVSRLAAKMRVDPA